MGVSRRPLRQLTPDMYSDTDSDDELLDRLLGTKTRTVYDMELSPGKSWAASA